MEMSTIIVLVIAVFIIVYRIKTWNDVDVLAKKSDIVEEVVEYKVQDSSVTIAKPKATKKTTVKENKTSNKPYKKTLKADLPKNQLLAKALDNSLGEQLVFEISSEPTKATSTLITLFTDESQSGRAVGLIYEKNKSTTTIIKTFDVKMQDNDQFKVVTSFSKSLSIKKSEMKTQSIDATHLFVPEDKSVLVGDVVLTLK